MHLGCSLLLFFYREFALFKNKVYIGKSYRSGSISIQYIFFFRFFDVKNAVNIKKQANMEIYN